MTRRMVAGHHCRSDYQTQRSVCEQRDVSLCRIDVIWNAIALRGKPRRRIDGAVPLSPRSSAFFSLPLRRQVVDGGACARTPQDGRVGGERKVEGSGSRCSSSGGRCRSDWSSVWLSTRPGEGPSAPPLPGPPHRPTLRTLTSRTRGLGKSWTVDVVTLRWRRCTKHNYKYIKTLDTSVTNTVALKEKCAIGDVLRSGPDRKATRASVLRNVIA